MDGVIMIIFNVICLIVCVAGIGIVLMLSRSNMIQRAENYITVIRTHSKKRYKAFRYRTYDDKLQILIYNPDTRNLEWADIYLFNQPDEIIQQLNEKF